MLILKQVQPDLYTSLVISHHQLGFRKLYLTIQNTAALGHRFLERRERCSGVFLDVVTAHLGLLRKLKNIHPNTHCLIIWSYLSLLLSRNGWIFYLSFPKGKVASQALVYEQCTWQTYQLTLKPISLIMQSIRAVYSPRKLIRLLPTGVFRNILLIQKDN